MANAVFYSRDQEREAAAQKKEKRQGTRRVQILAALEGQS